VEVVQAGLGRFLQKVDVEPSFASGRFQGFRIVELRPGAFWQDVDLRPGDVVLRVNGMPIERETQAYDAFQSLRTANELRVEYLRAGQPRALVYPILDP
jgi:type II secretory pathway component PulC